MEISAVHTKNGICHIIHACGSLSGMVGHNKPNNASLETKLSRVLQWYYYQLILLLVFRVLIKRDNNLGFQKALFGFILMQYIYLAVTPSPTHGTPYHLHFSQSMLSTGCSPSRIYIPITQRPD